jgi:hypothetical protein
MGIWQQIKLKTTNVGYSDTDITFRKDPPVGSIIMELQRWTDNMMASSSKTVKSIGIRKSAQNGDTIT